MKRKLLNLRFAKTTVFRTIMYLLITAVFLSLFSIPVFAEYKDLLVVQIENPMMTVNGVSKEIDPGRGTVPMIINNRTLLPIRSLIEEMGGTVGWDQGERRVDIKLGTIDIKLWIDDKTALVNDKKVGMDVPPQIINNRTWCR